MVVDREPDCPVCLDTRLMKRGEAQVSCTYCPRPCEGCNDGRGFCKQPYCGCSCHGSQLGPRPNDTTPIIELVVVDVARALDCAIQAAARILRLVEGGNS